MLTAPSVVNRQDDTGTVQVDEVSVTHCAHGPLHPQLNVTIQVSGATDPTAWHGSVYTT